MVESTSSNIGRRAGDDQYTIDWLSGSIEENAGDGINEAVERPDCSPDAVNGKSMSDAHIYLFIRFARAPHMCV